VIGNFDVIKMHGTTIKKKLKKIAAYALKYRFSSVCSTPHSMSGNAMMTSVK
jgi:hypothetical protein